MVVVKKNVTTKEFELKRLIKKKVSMFQLLKCADYLCTFTFQCVISTFDLSKGSECSTTVG